MVLRLDRLEEEEDKTIKTRPTLEEAGVEEDEEEGYQNSNKHSALRVHE